MVIIEGKYNLLHKILTMAKWRGKDEFPSDDIWACEAEKWLNFIDLKGQLTRFMPRLTKQDTKKRDEAFAEISSAYFLEKICEVPVIEWEPIGLKNSRGDFMLSVDSTSIFCEVKSPGWESDVVDQQGVGSPRLGLPKYINGEVKGIDNSRPIRYAIDKAYKKLPGDKPTLLIFNDDLWFSIFNEMSVSTPDEMPLCIYRALFYEPKPPPYTDKKPKGYFKIGLYERLSGILFLNVINSGTIVYKNKIFENEHALNKLSRKLLKLRRD